MGINFSRNPSDQNSIQLNYRGKNIDVKDLEVKVSSMGKRYVQSKGDSTVEIKINDLLKAFAKEADKGIKAELQKHLVTVPYLQDKNINRYIKDQKDLDPIQIFVMKALHALRSMSLTHEKQYNRDEVAYKVMDLEIENLNATIEQKEVHLNQLVNQPFSSDTHVGIESMHEEALAFADQIAEIKGEINDIKEQKAILQDLSEQLKLIEKTRDEYFESIKDLPLLMDNSDGSVNLSELGEKINATISQSRGVDPNHVKNYINEQIISVIHGSNDEDMAKNIEDSIKFAYTAVKTAPNTSYRDSALEELYNKVGMNFEKFYYAQARSMEKEFETMDLKFPDDPNKVKFETQNTALDEETELSGQRFDQLKFEDHGFGKTSYQEIYAVMKNVFSKNETLREKEGYNSNLAKLVNGYTGRPLDQKQTELSDIFKTAEQKAVFMKAYEESLEIKFQEAEAKLKEDIAISFRFQNMDIYDVRGYLFSIESKLPAAAEELGFENNQFTENGIPNYSQKLNREATLSDIYTNFEDQKNFLNGLDEYSSSDKY